MSQQIFDQMCIDFWRQQLQGDRLENDVNLILFIGQLNNISRVLDLGSGTGRIAKALAEKGIDVVGVERSWQAYKEAISSTNPNCTFINSDWKEKKWEGLFNCALFWFTTLCEGRKSDLQSLEIAYSSLVYEGFLLIETRHWDRKCRKFEEKSEHRLGNDILIEMHSYNPVTGVQTTVEEYNVGNTITKRIYHTRRYSFAELSEMCIEVGFRKIDGFDENGLVLSDQSERAILRAQK